MYISNFDCGNWPLVAGPLFGPLNVKPMNEAQAADRPTVLKCILLGGALGAVWLACFSLAVVKIDNPLTHEIYLGSPGWVLIAAASATCIGSALAITVGIPALLSSRYRSFRTAIALLAGAIVLLGSMAALVAFLLAGGLNVRVTY